MTDYRTETTAALAARAREGDRVAFEELNGRYRERLMGQIRARMGRRVRSALEVEDVFQETISRALGAVTRFRWQGEESTGGSPGSPST